MAWSIVDVCGASACTSQTIDAINQQASPVTNKIILVNAPHLGCHPFK